MQTFHEAFAAYETALHSGALLSAAERGAAAERFLQVTDQFRRGGRPALAILESELNSSEAYRCHTAGRILIELGERELLTRLSEEVINTGKPKLTHSDLARLWTMITPPRSLFEQIMNSPGWGSFALIRAVGRQNSPQSVSFLNEMLLEENWPILGQVIPSIDRWDDGQLLWEVFKKASAKKLSPDCDPRADVCLSAAFSLGLRGNTAAIAFLEDSANGEISLAAASACNYLAQLALPSAVKAVDRVLRTDNGDVLWYALNATTALGVPSLVPALFDAAQRRVFAYLCPPPMCDEAIRSLWVIVGYPPNLDDEYVPDLFPEEFTESFRQNAIAYAQAAIEKMDSGRRYHYGELRTTDHMLNDLMSPHGGPRSVAAHNLRAIFGIDYGFDPDDDLIANMPAIAAWRKHIAASDLLTPGGWAFRGEPIPGPQGH